MTPKEFIDENYFSLTLDCKRKIEEIYQALEDYAKTKQLTLTDVVKQSELLKDKESIDFEDWKVVEKVKYTCGKYFIGNTEFSYKQLIKEYTSYKRSL